MLGNVRSIEFSGEWLFLPALRDVHSTTLTLKVNNGSLLRIAFRMIVVLTNLTELKFQSDDHETIAAFHESINNGDLAHLVALRVTELIASREEGESSVSEMFVSPSRSHSRGPASGLT